MESQLRVLEPPAAASILRIETASYEALTLVASTSGYDRYGWAILLDQENLHRGSIFQTWSS